MQLPISHIFGQAPSEWWGFVWFELYFEGVRSFISSWLSSLIQLLCKMKSSFPSMTSEILKLWGCCLTNRNDDPLEEKPLLKLLLCEPRHRLACCRKEETAHYLGAGSQCVGESPLPAPQGLRRLWGKQSSNAILPRLINRYQLHLLFAPDSAFTW